MYDCTQIPSQMQLSDYDGDFKKYEEATYNAFVKTFAEKQLYYNGKRIGHKYRPEQDGKSFTFDHITSSSDLYEKNSEGRLPNLRRYECIEWPGYIMEHCLNSDCSHIKIWKNHHKGKNRVLILCDDIDYLVVLDERATYYIFWTAYPIEYENRKRRLLKEYSDYINEKAKAAQQN